MLLKLGGGGSSGFSLYNIIGISLLLGLNFVAYHGILAESETHRDADTLAGGMFLDLTGLVWVVQFGTSLLSNKCYYLLILIPVVGAWKLYSTLKGTKDAFMSPGDTTAAATGSQENDTKRKKRAERRQQKWS